MRFELLFFTAVAAIAWNMYYGNRFTKFLYQHKRQVKVALFLFVAFIVYFLFKKDPQRAKTMMLAYMGRNDWARFLPIKRNTFDQFGTMFDLTQHPQLGGGVLNEAHGGNLDAQYLAHQLAMEQLYAGAGATASATATASASGPTKKRAVSETKKKYVASMQNWRCGKCGEQLKHTFEVDHRVRLDQGGNNDVGNLVALCRECHGFKTSMENM